MAIWVPSGRRLACTRLDVSRSTGRSKAKGGICIGLEVGGRGVGSGNAWRRSVARAVAS